MGEKSYVTLEQHLCVVCGHPYDTGALLLDWRLRDKFDTHTITALAGMCPAHQKLFDDGFMALVEIDPTKIPFGKQDLLKQQDAPRTGVIVHIRRELAEQLEIPSVNPKTGEVYPMAWIEPEVTEHLKAMMPAEPANDGG